MQKAKSKVHANRNPIWRIEQCLLISAFATSDGSPTQVSMESARVTPVATATTDKELLVFVTTLSEVGVGLQK